MSYRPSPWFGTRGQRSGRKSTQADYSFVGNVGRGFVRGRSHGYQQGSEEHWAGSTRGYPRGGLACGFQGSISNQRGASGSGHIVSEREASSGQRDTVSQRGARGRGGTFSQRGTKGRGYTSNQRGTRGRGNTSSEKGATGDTSRQRGTRGDTFNQKGTRSQVNTSSQRGIRGRGDTSRLKKARDQGGTFTQRAASDQGPSLSLRGKKGQGHNLNQRETTGEQLHNVVDSYGNWYRQRGKESPQHKTFLDFPFIKQSETVGLMPQFLVMFILRGLPGSGKSTVADTILQQYKDIAVVCSADFYRYNKDGEYVWQEDKLQETHNKCQRRAEKFTALSKPVIIIDNTNIRHFEVQPYLKLAKQYAYVVVLVEPKTPWKFQAEELAKRNTHDVSYTKICRKVGQYDVIVPHYYAWFVSQVHFVRLRSLAKDILWKCLQIADFHQCFKTFSGHTSAKLTVHDAMSFYLMKKSDNLNHFHVTACFSPQGKYLAGVMYNEAVEKVLGHISQLCITGCVITNNTFSARVKLTDKQREIWMNDDVPQQHQKRFTAKGAKHSCQDVTSSFQHLQLEKSGVLELLDMPSQCTSASAHITLGLQHGINPVQAKYDVQTVLNHELLFNEFEEYTLQADLGIIRRYRGNVWAVYFNHVIKVPAIFSGCY